MIRLTLRFSDVSLLLCRSEGYQSAMSFSKEASSFCNSLLGSQREGPETDNGDSKLIGKRPKRVQESLPEIARKLAQQGA